MAVDKKAPLGHNAEMQVVIETRYFTSRAERILSDTERNDLTDFIASNPLRGDILVGTGGVRKMRFAVGNRGKSGGVRVIYYYYNIDKPIYLLEVFAKNEKTNLSKAEQNILAKIAGELKSQFERKRP